MPGAQALGGKPGWLVKTHSLERQEANGIGYRNQIVTIERLVPEGKGLGRLGDGRVVLAERVVPGDEIELLAGVDRGRCVLVDDWKLVRGGPNRVVPACPYWELCGGCDWMMLDSGHQTSAKATLVVDALRRTGRIADAQQHVAACVGAASRDYRRRIRLHIRAGHVGFQRRRSHDLVQIERCLVARPAVNAALSDVRRAVEALGTEVSAYDGVEVRESSDGRVSLYFSVKRSLRGRGARRTGNRDNAAVRDALRGQLEPDYLVQFEGEDQVDPAKWQRYELPGGVQLFSAPGCFTQVHWQVNELLVRALVEGAVARGATRFLDLYCGAGNFSLPLAARGLTGVGVEVQPLSVRTARHAQGALQQPENLEFIEADVPSYVQSLKRSAETFDLVLLDPPRAGVASGLLQIAQLSRGWVAMCSCNPVTLARDLRLLIDAGWIVETVQPMDMFPQTHHVETLAWVRSPSREKALSNPS